MDVSITIQTQAPAGTSLSFRGSSVPTGYLAEDGSVISRVTYARLFAAIGTTYGAGDGSTTFKLPDSRGRVDVASGSGSGLTARTLAATGGEESHQLTTAEMPSHTHTQDAHNHSQNAHSHTVPGRNAAGAGTSITNGQTTPPDTNTSTTSVTATNNATTATNQNTGGDGFHNNMQPFLVVTKIIKF